MFHQPFLEPYIPKNVNWATFTPCKIKVFKTHNLIAFLEQLEYTRNLIEQNYDQMIALNTVSAISIKVLFFNPDVSHYLERARQPKLREHLKRIYLERLALAFFDAMSPHAKDRRHDPFLFSMFLGMQSIKDPLKPTIS